MTDVTADVDRNLLTISFDEFLSSRDDVDDFYASLQQAAARFGDRRDFDVIADLRAAPLQPNGVAVDLSQLAVRPITSGRTAVVVSSALAGLQVRRIAADTSAVSGAMFRSMEEAESWLGVSVA